jgi:hypothetical protein
VDTLTRRKTEPYREFLARVKEEGGDAQVVKEADMEHNLGDLRGFGAEERAYAIKKYTKGLAFLRDE